MNRLSRQNSVTFGLSRRVCSVRERPSSVHRGGQSQGAASLGERTSTTGGPALRKISPSTVRRAVKALGLSSCAPAQKPFVSAANKPKRLQWGKEHLSWSYRGAWILFSGDNSFQVRQPQSRSVWRLRGQRFQTKNPRPAYTNGRESEMMWGAFSARGRTPLVRAEGSMNGASYVMLLETVNVHYLCANYEAPDGTRFREDLAPCPTAQVARPCKDALGIKLLTWVGETPDLNPIENAWVDLERRLRSRSVSPKTKDELFAAFQEEWTAIPDAFFKKLTESMCRRVRGVVAPNGAGTKY
eukprot:contig_1611_g250